MCQEVASEFFATNAPDPPHWTLILRFGAFATILVHSGPFGCLTKLGAKRAELVQKFVKRSRIRFFRNERTRSTLLDPKLTFWCVCYYLGAFGTVLLPYETRCKTGRTSAKKFVLRSRIGIFHKECTRSTPLDPKLTFSCVSYYLGAFRTIWLPYETRCKLGVQKFMPRSRVGILRNEHSRSSPLDPIPTIWCVSYLDAFRTVWMPYETRCKTDQTSAKVLATKSRRNFSQTNAPSSPLDPKLTF